MPKQLSIIKVKGTMGGMTFYKTAADGHLIREKGGVSKERIMNDPAFQRTRENGSEFGRAGIAGKTLRLALRGLLTNAADGRLTGRLVKAMVKVIQADSTSERGLRNVIDGEAELLSKFEFNIRGKLGTSFFAPYTASIDRVTGALKVDVPSFVPSAMINAPSGTTHFKVVSGGAEIDFEEETFVNDNSSSAILPWDTTPTVAISQTNQVTAASTKPLFLALGVEFFQQVNGTMYPLKNGAFNPLALVQVSGL